MVSLIFEQSNLGVDNSFSLSIAMFSNPWSMNETSFPPALVPETVLIWVPMVTSLLGINVLNWGMIVSNW